VLHDILRRPICPKTKKVADLLREFQKGRSMAIVVDEYGGTPGW